MMVDDTDYKKTGKCMEYIRRVHFHVEHKSVLDFKAQFMGITGGTSQILLDFTLLGEKGKKGNYGMNEKVLEHPFTKKTG